MEVIVGEIRKTKAWKRLKLLVERGQEALRGLPLRWRRLFRWSGGGGTGCGGGGGRHGLRLLTAACRRSSHGTQWVSEHTLNKPFQ